MLFDTLRTTVAPVCRAWYQAIRDRFIRDVAWDDARKDKELSKVLAGIPGAGRLLWHAHGTNGDLAMEQWTKLQSALSRDYNRRQRGQGHSMRRLMLDSPLLQLELSGSVDIANCLPRIHKYLGSLTCLKLFLSRDCTIDVEPLFRDCLGLEVVHLETTGFLETVGEWVSTAQQAVGGAHPPIQLQLQTLVLWNASVHQAGFERFLTMTPRLRRLKCTSMQLQRSESLYWDRGIAYDQAHFYQHVVALPYRLESFHLSFEDGLPAISGFSKSLRVCPVSSEWTVDTLDLPLSMMMVLQDQPNHVTTLELVCYSHSERSTQSVLHRYLCQAPHLLHLRARNIILPVAELDIHGLLTTPSTEPAVTPTPGTDTVPSPSGAAAAAAVWACRRLRSLQVTFGWGSRESSLVLVQSRVIFGYISRVCSELKELTIYRPESSEDDVDEARSTWLDLKGGLCLLSRLEHLERLQIGSGLKEIGCERVDLDWMVRSGFVGVRRYVRVLEISNWYGELLEERELMDVDELTAGGRKNREDGLELRYLGRLQDVATRLEELDAVDVVGVGGSRCWPLLSRLSIDCGSEFGRQPERELQRILG
ncbi:hypothetical protein KI688_000953 [Linnemannia hyalina]|uniref:Uncharacterized protein n=1 Tax=Linnemannia hyalina TaxID=64524 RepID=A0A9P8BZ30_9FUNG|nr:hypothetical protein KI688_000953 [Linnemannia hyalina]